MVHKQCMMLLPATKRPPKNETNAHKSSINQTGNSSQLSKFRQMLSPDSSPWVCFGGKEERGKPSMEQKGKMCSIEAPGGTSDGEFFDGGIAVIGTSGSSDGDEDLDGNHRSLCNQSWNWMEEPISDNILSVSPVPDNTNTALKNIELASSHGISEKSKEPLLISRQSRPPRKTSNASSSRGRSRMDGSDSSSEYEGATRRRSRSRSHSLMRRQHCSSVRGLRNRGSTASRSRSISRSRPGRKLRGTRSHSVASKGDREQNSTVLKQQVTASRSRSISRSRPGRKLRETRSHSVASKEDREQNSTVLKQQVRPRRSRSRSILSNRKSSSQSKRPIAAKKVPPSPPLSPTTEILSPTNNEALSREKAAPWPAPPSHQKTDESADRSHMNSNVQLKESYTSAISSTRAAPIAGDRPTATQSTRLKSGPIEPNFLSQTSLESTSTKFSSPHYNIHTRSLLTTSVYHNEATDIWITTINMSQNSKVTKSNAAKYLMAFSFATEREARESAYANAPPKMLPFRQNPFCFTCGGKFSVFRRACHCRNCGVCICNSCSTNWRKISLPETYNIKNESSLKVCKSCTMLSSKFQRALLEGNCEDAQLVYNTGNINLRCPFMNNIKGGEAMFPIHCASEGGNLMLLAWLVDVHFCPIKRIRTNGNKTNSQASDELITTSRGRTVVEISMANQRVDILRYLVNEKNVSVCGVKNLQTSLAALEAVLKSYPQLQEENNEQESFVQGTHALPTLLPSHERCKRNHISNDLPSFSISGPNDDDDSTDSACNSVHNIDSEDDESVATTVPDACIICYANSIDCVITPCGHQICCLQCSTNLSTCPVCNVDCKFIRIFRP